MSVLELMRDGQIIEDSLKAFVNISASSAKKFNFFVHQELFNQTT
jgi:hypothetical protein